VENYILRIYRRDCADPRRVDGLLESVEQESQQSFNDLNTLGTLLESKLESPPEESGTSIDQTHNNTLALVK